MNRILFARLSRVPAARLVGALALALAGALAPSAGAAQRGDAQEDAPADTQRVVLRFAEGKSWRGVARRGPDGWELRQGAGWQVVPDAYVLAARPEREVLAEARERRAGIDASDYLARARHAAWMLAEGLFAEAVEELDRVLAFEPDQAEALAALAATPPPVALPSGATEEETRAELLRFGAQAGGVGRELVVARLAELEDRAALAAALEAELVDGSVRRRSFATLALRRLMPGTAVEALLGRAVLDASEDVRAGAALALRDTGEVGVIVPVVRALDSAHPAIRANAAEALGAIGHPAAVEPLMTHLLTLSAQGRSASRVPHSHIFVGKQFAYVQDYDVEVAQFQVVADPQINVLVTGAVLDTGVHSVRAVAFAHERKMTRGALRRLTGADPGDTTAAWARWWEQNAARWRAEELSRPSPDARAGS
jgi:hypothetical protein